MNDYLALHELYHHGIKGQKWGVRRFQNKDGSLTDEGKRRYYDAHGVRTKEGEEDLVELEKTMKSQADQMSSLLKKYDVKDPERLDERNFDKDGAAYDNYWDYTSNLKKYAELNGHTDIDEEDVKLYNKLYKERKQDMKTYSYLSISDRSGKNDFVTIGKDIAKFTLMPFITLKLLYLGKTSMDIETAKQNSKERKIYSGKNSSVQHSYVGDYIDNAENYLAHHGIKGQRWGVRRFQDENGSMTAEGKARYGIDENGRMSKEGKALYKQDKKDQRTLDNTGYQNWTQAAGRTALKYLGASGATAVAGFVAEHLALKSGNAKLAAAISAGHTIAQSVITAAGTAHMIVSGVKGAKEKAKILESQKDKMQHSDDELAHFGIFGMKWGVRRFQNKDGTLTEAGKVRYKANPDGAISPKGEGRVRYNADVNDPRQLMIDDVGSAVSTTAGAAKGVSEQIRNIPTKTGSVVRGKYSNISDAELQKRINRLSLEQRYSDLVGDTHYVKSGGEKVKEIFQTVGATAGIVAALTPLTIFVASHMYKKK